MPANERPGQTDRRQTATPQPPRSDPKAAGPPRQAARPSGPKAGGADQQQRQPPISVQPPGLDAQRHAASQRHARHADIIREQVFPALMSTALSVHGAIEPGAYKVYLERLLEDAGNPSDPIQVMLTEQICLAHFRIGQLHAKAAQAETVDAIKALTAATARLLGEMRRTALALSAVTGRVPAGKSGPTLKIFKDAV